MVQLSDHEATEADSPVLTCWASVSWLCSATLAQLHLQLSLTVNSHFQVVVQSG